MHLRPGPGGSRPRPRHGVRDGHCNACHDQLRQTTFYKPAHDSGHDPTYQLGDGTASPVLSASATTARATAVASGPVAAGLLTTQMISSVVCALLMLAVLAAAAWLAVTVNTVGSGGGLGCRLVRDRLVRDRHWTCPVI